MSQPKLLALFTALVVMALPIVADARGGGGPSGHGGISAGRPADVGRGLFGRDEVRDLARALHGRDATGRPTEHGALAEALDRDEHGAPILWGAIIAVTPSKDDFDAAQRLHFTVDHRDELSELGIASVTLLAPNGMNASTALAALRAASPGGTFDYAHIYNPVGDAGSPAISAVTVAFSSADRVTVGMIDGGAWKQHRALRRASIRMRGFAGGSDTPPTIHGTAVASLLVGTDRDFSGYVAGARLYAADVFGGRADGGSADKIARALDWLAENRIAVSNISLAGPHNALLAAAVKAFVAKGHVLVAAVGNDGPAAPANYPAAYPGVVAVTSVDAARRIAFDANRTSTGFAAVGVDVRAAGLPEGYARFNGTSYAAPAVTAGFARLLDQPDAARAKRAFEVLAKASMRLDGELYFLDPSRLPSRTE